MQIISGKVSKAQKVVIYGSEGIGKSTLASQFPKPLFIDVEDSTLNMEVDRLPKPTSWQMLLEQLEFVKTTDYKTLVIDTADWAENLCKEHVMAKNKWNAIDASGYGVRYVALANEWGAFLNKLSDIANKCINIVITAHSQIKKFELPDEMGAYDRWELKLEKKTASLIKEWADMILFCNYKTIVLSSSDGKNNKAKGQERIMYTSHNAVWDAKNRHGLTDSLPMEFSSIAHIFEVKQEIKKEKPKIEDVFPDIIEDVDMSDIVNPFLEEDKPDNMPQGLWDLMQQNDVRIKDIQEFSASQGITPVDTPIENYPNEYLMHLQAEWSKVLNLIKK